MRKVTQFQKFINTLMAIRSNRSNVNFPNSSIKFPSPSFNTCIEKRKPQCPGKIRKSELQHKSKAKAGRNRED